MQTLIDAQLLREIRETNLRYTCEECTHHCPTKEVPSGLIRCSLGYPTEAHQTRTLREGELMVFCKEFDLR